MKYINTKKSGFTLVELIVVIAIIGILSTIALPKLTNYIIKAQATTAKANARTVYTTALAANMLAKTDNDPATIPAGGDGGDPNNFFKGKTLDMINEQLDGNMKVVLFETYLDINLINGEEGKNNYVINVFEQHTNPEIGVEYGTKYIVYFWNPESYHSGIQNIDGEYTYSTFVNNKPGIDFIIF